MYKQLQACLQSSNTGSSQSVSQLKSYVKMLPKTSAPRMIIGHALIQNNQSINKPSQTTAKHGSTTSDLPLSPILLASHASTTFTVDDPTTVHQLNQQTALPAEQSCSVDCGDTLLMKEESGDTEVDIGPTAYQHMDSYYRTNKDCTAVKQESATDNSNVDATPDGGARQESIGARSNISIIDYRQKTFCSKTSITDHITRVRASRSFKCNKCDKSFKCEKDLKVHTASIHIGLVKECNICGKFMRPSNLKQHILSMHSGKELRCKICGEIVMSKLNLHLHFNSVHGQQSTDSPFVHRCGYCQKIYPGKRNLNAHIKSVHGIIHKCSQCKVRFVNEADLQRHIKSIHSKENHEGSPFVNRCCYCQRVYSDKRNLSAHLKSVHGIFHRCSKCDMKFISEAGLQKHIESAHPKQKHAVPPSVDRCCYCQRIYSDKRKLNAHLKSVHEIFQRCSECELKFVSEAGLQRHIKSVHPKQKHADSPFVHRCAYCQKIYPGKKNLNAHIKSVHGIFLRCSECKASFRSKARLQSHINLLHSEENHKDAVPNTYICDYCQKTFSMKLSVINHITNVHAIGSYKCDLCDKSFRCDKDLKVHKASAHIALVKECTVCGKFLTPSILKEHMLSMHSGKKLQCKVCGEFVKSTQDLHYHLNNVHGQQSTDSPFINRCSYCQKVFSTKKTLNSHLKKLHGKVFRRSPERKASFKSKNRLQRNIKSAHSKERHEDSPFINRCGYCHRIYAHKKTLNVHLINVHGGSCHSCSKCKSIFMSEALLHRHVKLVHSEEKYQESSESTHPPVGEVNAGASTQQQEVIVMKEEPTDEELELGPVVFQHMDCNYRPYKEEPTV